MIELCALLLAWSTPSTPLWAQITITVLCALRYMGMGLLFLASSKRNY